MKNVFLGFILMVIVVTTFGQSAIINSIPMRRITVSVDGDCQTRGRLVGTITILDDKIKSSKLSEDIMKKYEDIIYTITNSEAQEYVDIFGVDLEEVVEVFEDKTKLGSVISNITVGDSTIQGLVDLL